MAEQPTVYQIENYEGETGKNWDKRRKFETSLPGLKFYGYPEAIAQALVPLGFVPGAKDVDVPGSLDDIANALDSDGNVLLRRNFVGQQVPTRVEEYIEDRGDFVTGAIADYFLSPLLKTVGYFFAGYSSKNEKDAEKFITNLEKRYPIDPRWRIEAALARYDYKGPEIPGFASTKKEPKEPEYHVTFSKIKEDGTKKPYREMRGNFPMSEWYRELCKDGDTIIPLEKGGKIKLIREYIMSRN